MALMETVRTTAAAAINTIFKTLFLAFRDAALLFLYAIYSLSDISVILLLFTDDLFADTFTDLFISFSP